MSNVHEGCDRPKLTMTTNRLSRNWTTQRAAVCWDMQITEHAILLQLTTPRHHLSLKSTVFILSKILIYHRRNMYKNETYIL